MSNTHIVDSHTLTLLRNGEEYFPRLIAAIDNAIHSIYLETYIFAADSSGRMFSDAMQRAAKRGVEVHLLMDGFGSSDFPDRWVEELRAAGVQVLWFRPEIARFSLRRQRLHRLHRKLAVVDQRIAFVGGINIIDDVPGGAINLPRLDYAVEIQGTTTAHIFAPMQRLWALVSWTNFRRRQGTMHEILHPVHAIYSQQKVTFLLRDNLRHRHDIEQAYLNAINGAQHEIIIANAYFLPGLRLRHALINAVQRGVRVVLLLQGRVEYRLQHYAALALYDELLGAGVEINEYYASFLHAKVAVVDKCWATVGSSNIDPFSLWLGREANLVVHDEGFAESLRSSLLYEISAASYPVEHSVWRTKKPWKRWLARTSYIAARMLTGLIGYARGGDDV
jgi:cardiolipin synthase A/B